MLKLCRGGDAWIRLGLLTGTILNRSTNPLGAASLGCTSIIICGLEPRWDELRLRRRLAGYMGISSVSVIT